VSRIDAIFRPVPRTGVIYVMAEAGMRGFRYGDPEWCNLGQGAPEVGAFEGGIPRLQQIELVESQYEYAPVHGLLELRQAVAELYNTRYRRGLASKYTADNVAICSGGRLGLTRAVTALGPIHLGHLLPDYTAYEELLDVFHIVRPMPISLHRRGGFRMTPERFRTAVVELGLGAMLLSNPCNPTGQLIEGDDLAQLVATGDELGCALIIDEFYSHYVYNGTLGSTVSAAAYVNDVNSEPVVIIDGLTKNWRYPGLRLSWTLGPESVIERIASAGSFLDGGAPHPLQRAAIPLLDPDAAAAEARAIQREFARKRTVCIERLRAMGFVLYGEPDGAFYCFASLQNLPAPYNEGMAFFRAALERKVITVPGEFFDVNPGQRRGHIPSRMRDFVRISYGPSMDQVVEGLDRIEAMLAGR
jgi:aspartate/methionine/tyrosine aminotransferase